MADIKITEPINMELSVLGAEDNLPSFEVSIDILTSSFFGDFKYHFKSIWFECSKWDHFVNDTMLINSSEVVLQSMCESFELKLSKEKNNYQFSLHCEARVRNKGKICADIEQTVTRDILLQISQCFERFPKWW